MRPLRGLRGICVDRSRRLHDAVTAVDELLEILDNRDVAAALERFDRRNGLWTVALPLLTVAHCRRQSPQTSPSNLFFSGEAPRFPLFDCHVILTGGLRLPCCSTKTFAKIV
jgi:hypothetical protein